MDQKNILPRGIAKPIEQQSDGTWIVRHHFRVVGTSENCLLYTSDAADE